ncbi:MAG: TfoX domain protein [Xanthobacteraceae bacterium]|nr:TfoX domain protein [Xanthobacteraceae bacterium]
MTPDDVADIFAAFRPVRCRRMFGGLGIYADGVMFGLVAFERIYLKADPDFSRDLEALGAERFTYEAKGRQVSLPYWTLPESAIDDAEAAAELAARALRVALTAAAAKPPRRPKRPKA